VPALAQVVLRDSVERVRVQAAAALGQIGPPAVSAVPALIRALHDKGRNAFVNDAAEKALSQIGPVAIPLLKDALCGEYGAGSGKALAGMGTRALPTLIEGLKTEGCRAGAAIGVGQMGPMAASAVPALIAAVADNSRDVRTWSVRALGQIGPQAKDAVPVLIATLKDSDKWVRLDAVVALGKIGPAARPAIPGLRAMLSDPDQQIRLNAQATLKAIEAR
jgi:HEAT repeat protein